MGYARDMAEAKFPPGSQVQMLESHDPAGAVPEFARGKVIRVDENGRLEVMWASWPGSGPHVRKTSWVDIVRDNVTAVD